MKDVLSLPNDVLLHILSFLSMKEAISISVVSKEWQKMVNSLPFLCFDDATNTEFIETVDAYNFMNFVDGVLFNHKGGVYKFSIKCGVYVDANRIRGWIQYAISNGVKELDLNQCLNLDRLPLRVYTCETLEVLRVRIRFNKFCEMPTNICLPNLKTLDLCGFHDTTSIKRLICSCPMLEELEIIHCSLNQSCSFSLPTLKRLNLGFFIHGTAHIDAPNLAYFKCFYHQENFLVKNLNSLVEADIDFRYGYAYEDYYSATIDLFKAISNVKSLHISGGFEQVFRRVGGLLPTLSKLTHLSFESHVFTEWERWISVLPQCFPHVVTLDWNVKLNDVLGRRMVKKAEIPPPCSWSQLKKLNISSFENRESELLMMEYILNSALSLEKLTVRSRNLSSAQRRSITRKLFKFKKASNKCKIIF